MIHYILTLCFCTVASQWTLEIDTAWTRKVRKGAKKQRSLCIGGWNSKAEEKRKGIYSWWTSKQCYWSANFTLIDSLCSVSLKLRCMSIFSFSICCIQSKDPTAVDREYFMLKILHFETFRCIWFWISPFVYGMVQQPWMCLAFHGWRPLP